MFETVRVERPSDQVLLVTLPRPAAANAMKTQMGIDLLEIFAQLFAHPDYCRAVVLTGAGERVFCAGGDLKERNGMSDAQLAGATPHFRAHIKAVIDLLPTARGRFWVPPAPGMIPIVASVCAKRCSGIGTLTVNPTAILAADVAGLSATPTCLGRSGSSSASASISATSSSMEVTSSATA